MKDYKSTYPNPNDDDQPESENQDGEGARPSSLVAVHRPKVIDPLHELNLLRMMQVANERTTRELGPLPPGGLPVPDKRKPTAPYMDFRGRVAPDEQLIVEENDEMKLAQVAATAALAVGTAACNPPTQASVAADSPHKTPGSTTRAPEKAAKPMLGPEYKKIDSFVDFRKKLLADGWKPVINPDCHDAVLGNTFDEVCRKDPRDVGCRVCDIVPEIFRNTSDGYSVMHYVKDGTPLSVTTYGDIMSFVHPETYDFVVAGWEYTTSINVIPMD